MSILHRKILFVTFTNTATNEMRLRIHGLPGDNDNGYINTFHIISVVDLLEDSHAVQHPMSLLMPDNLDIVAMMGTIYEESSLTLRDMTFHQARNMIENLKLLKRPDYNLDLVDLSLDKLDEMCLVAVSTIEIIFCGYLPEC